MNQKKAGPIEKMWIKIFLYRVREIPNDPSDRIKNLRTDSNNEKEALGPVDKIAFGTGDKKGYVTVTSDKKFVRYASL